MIVLTKEERLKFVAYLRQEAASNEIIAKQSATMDGLDMVVKRYKQKVAIYSIVANELESTEEQVIG